MNQKTEQLLRELAVKFETTTSHLWEVMIQQAAITATMNVIMASFLTGMIVITCCFVKAKTTPKPNSLDPPAPHVTDWSDDKAFVVWYILILVTIFLTGVVIYLILTAVTASLNPEYWALQQILELKR